MYLIESEHQFMMVAMHNYHNAQITSLDEFQADIGRIWLIKRLLERFTTNNSSNLRLLLNHFVILHNVFEDAAIPLILYRFSEEGSNFLPIIKSIFIFLGWTTEDGVPHVESSPEWNTLLGAV